MPKKCHVTAAMMLAILASLELLAQSWSLPQGASVKDDGPRTYRFTVEYFMANTQGRDDRPPTPNGRIHASSS